jgi:hypothetical protein
MEYIHKETMNISTSSKRLADIKKGQLCKLRTISEVMTERLEKVNVSVLQRVEEMI